MKANYWKIKNSYAAKSYIDQEARERSGNGKRLTMRSTQDESCNGARGNE